MFEAFIIAGRRTPFVKSFTHYRSIRNQQMLAACASSLVGDFGLRGVEIGDVALGAVIKHSSDYNLSREVVLDSGLSPTTPGLDLQRACGTGLEAVINISNKIRLGQIESGLAGGSDTNSDPPVHFKRESVQKLLQVRMARSRLQKVAAALTLRPIDFSPEILAVREPRTRLSMGEHCEMMAKQWNVSREEQDELALRSHRNGVQAYQGGFYRDWVIRFREIERDTLLREDTSMKSLAGLAPSFDKDGTLTAGNSTPLTDGAGIVLLTSSEEASRRGWKPLAKVRDAVTAAVDFVHGEGLLMAPTVAVSRLLGRHRLQFKDISCFEIHEAFAAQVLCTLKAWESNEYCRNRLALDRALGSIDFTRLNLQGGSIALGHPFAATGARQSVTMAKLLSEKRGALGLVTACTAGGMGVAVLMEGY